MAYCTLTDLQNVIQVPVLIQISNDDPDAGTVNTVIITDAIRRADNFIDSFLKGRYTLPLTTVPESIRDLSIRVTIYYLYRRAVTSEAPKNLADDYKDCKAMLTRIQLGEFNPFEVVQEPTFITSNTVRDGNTSPLLAATSTTVNWDKYFI